MKPEERIARKIEEVHADFQREMRRRTKPSRILNVAQGKTFAGQAAELIAEGKRHRATEEKLLTLISRYVDLKNRHAPGEEVRLPNEMARVLTEYIRKPRQPRFHSTIERKKRIVDAVRRHHEKVKVLYTAAELILAKPGMRGVVRA